jgi:hypothetical protein
MSPIVRWQVHSHPTMYTLHGYRSHTILRTFQSTSLGFMIVPIECHDMNARLSLRKLIICSGLVLDRQIYLIASGMRAVPSGRTTKRNKAYHHYRIPVWSSWFVCRISSVFWSYANQLLDDHNNRNRCWPTQLRRENDLVVEDPLPFRRVSSPQKCPLYS